MINDNRSFPEFVKEAAFALGIIACIIICDCTWTDFYLWDLYDTGRFIFNAVTSFHIRGWRLLKYLIPIVFAFVAIKKRTDFHYGAIIPILFVYSCFFVITLIKTPESLWRFWDSFEAPIITILFVTLLFQKKENAGRFFKALAVLYTVALAANAAFKLFPNLYDVFFASVGWRPECFISGVDNTISPFLLDGMLYAMMNAYYTKDNKLLIVYLIVFCLNEYLCWCATAIVAGAVMLLLLIPQIKKIIGKTDFLVFIVLSLLLFVVLVFLFDYISNFAPIRFVLNNILHKNLKLGDRTILWKKEIPIILQNPLFGHGMGETPHLLREVLENGLIHTHHHAHNIFLQIWYEGGLFSILAFIALLVHTAAVLRRMNDRTQAGILQMALFSILLWGEADLCAWIYLFPIFLVIQITCLSVELERQCISPDICSA